MIVDLVPNHTSDEHEWFQAALAAGPGSPERARYLFRDSPRRTSPNNWSSVFGGPAWTQVDGRPVVPPPLRLHPARPRLAQPRGAGDVRGRAALLARPRASTASGSTSRTACSRRTRCATRSWPRARPPRPVRSTPTTRWSRASSRTSRCGTSPRSTTSTARWHRVLDESGARPDGRRRGLDPDARVDGRASSVPTSSTRPSTSPGCSPTGRPRPSPRSSPARSTAVAPVGASPDLGAQQPRRRTPPHPLRRRRAGPGPRPRRDAGDARAAGLGVPLPGRGARPGAGRRRRRRTGRTRPALRTGEAAATAAGCRSRGAATRRRTTSGRAPTQPWIPQPADWAVTDRGGAGRPTTTRRWRSTARRWPLRRTFACDRRRRRSRCSTLRPGRARVPARPRHRRAQLRAGSRSSCPTARSSSPADRSDGALPPDTAVWLR